MSKPDILIIGNGYLGNRFAEYFGERAQLHKPKLNSLNEILELFQNSSQKVVLNAAGNSGTPNVDACENQPLKTIHENIILPFWIAKACQETGKRMVHLTSACLYDGYAKDFTEEDAPFFDGNLYCITRRESESILTTFNPQPLLIRFRFPLDNRSNPRGLIDKLLAYAKKGNPIVDTPNSLIYVPDLLDITSQLIEKNATGIFHVVNKGGATHSMLLDYCAKASKEPINYTTCSSIGLNEVTIKRRTNMILSVQKLEDLGIHVPSVEEAIKRATTEYFKPKP